MTSTDVSKVASINVKQRSEKYPGGTFHESGVVVFIFCTAVMIPLISNKKQAVTNILRVTRISGSYKHLNLCWERQLKYEKIVSELLSL